MASIVDGNLQRLWQRPACPERNCPTAHQGLALGRLVGLRQPPQQGFSPHYRLSNQRCISVWKDGKPSLPQWRGSVVVFPLQDSRRVIAGLPVSLWRVAR